MRSLHERLSEAPPEVQELLEEGYKETDAQFNLASDAYHSIPAYDLVLPSVKRVLWTPVVEITSERVIRAILGEDAVFPVEEIREQSTLYSVPFGARPLARTLCVSPYERRYMETLHRRGEEFLRKLSLLDPNSFGININRLAISHDGDPDDDAILTIIPPVEPISDEHYRGQPDKLISHFEYLKGSL